MIRARRRSKQRGYVLSKQNHSQARSRVSVGSHRMFPAVVALWFGALFGLGSLAVRPALIESLVLASRLEVLLPAAAPPLGMTARVLLALGMAVIGVACGAMIARRIARPRPAERERRHWTPAVEDDLASDHRREAAPLPGGAAQILDLTQFDLVAPGDRLPAMEEGVAQPRRFIGAAQDVEAPSPAVPRCDMAAIASEQPAPSPAAMPRASLALPEGSAAARIVSAELTELSPVELIERLALAMQRRHQAGTLPAGSTETAEFSTSPALPQLPEAGTAPAASAAFAVEPVVIFPGQQARAGIRLLRPAGTRSEPPPVADPAPRAAPVRSPAASAAAERDPAETERALRSALATLQRMSGAA